MAETSIEWTDATWNPVAGCTVLTAGCTNCYAMRMAARLQAMGHPSYRKVTRKSGHRPVWSGRIQLNANALSVPSKWRKPRKIFVNSMSDLFQDGIPAEFIARVWHTMHTANWHIFQVLTKRPENMLRVVTDLSLPVLPNVWLGTSVESAEYKWRIERLRSVPAAIRFVSFEPLIGRIGEIDLHQIHWAIVGGESGPRARPMHVEWVDEIRKQCDENEITFFFKQWGGVNKKAAGREYRGRIWNEFPVIASAPGTPSSFTPSP